MSRIDASHTTKHGKILERRAGHRWAQHHGTQAAICVLCPEYALPAYLSAPRVAADTELSLFAVRRHSKHAGHSCLDT
jgi:hypothetical protein